MMLEKEKEKKAEKKKEQKVVCIGSFCLSAVCFNFLFDSRSSGKW